MFLDDKMDNRIERKGFLDRKKMFVQNRTEREGFLHNKIDWKGFLDLEIERKYF